MEQHTENPTGRIGTAMTVAGWLLLLGLLILLFGNHSKRQAHPNQQLNSRSVNGLVEIRLLQNRQGHYIADGQINGQPVTFMLDTGATLISVPLGLANRLALRPGPAIDVQTANGSISVHLTRLDKVSLGDIERHDLRATINPYMDDDMILLGMEFLKDLRLEQRNDALIITQQQGR